MKIFIIHWTFASDWLSVVWNMSNFYLVYPQMRCYKFVINQLKMGDILYLRQYKWIWSIVMWFVFIGIACVWKIIKFTYVGTWCIHIYVAIYVLYRALFL